jgi:phenylacetic acid degradation protein
MIYAYKSFIPVIHPTAYIHPQASVTGNVIIGAYVFIGAGASIRADFGAIEIEEGCNVQENCVIHMFPGVKVLLKEGAHIGHGAIIHGATIGKNCLIGMNAVVMDEVVLEEECIVGALSFIAANQCFQKRSLIVGNPAKKIKEVSDEMMEWKTKGTAIYKQLAQDMHLHSKPCSPIFHQSSTLNEQPINYTSWNKLNKNE